MNQHQQQLASRLTGFISDAQELRARLVAMRDQLRARRGAPDDGAAHEAFADSRFSYRDAEALAGLWGTTVDNAKLSIGLKVLGGNDKMIEEDLYEALIYERKLSEDLSDGDAELFDLYADSRYSYDDAEALSKLWHTGVYDAKLLIGTKIKHRDQKLLEALLYEARIYERKLSEDLSDGDAKLFDLYADSRYSYDDAEALSKLWRTDVYSAKLRIGTKILHGDQKLLYSEVLTARKLTPDPKTPLNDEKALSLYLTSRYAYNDAEVLARLWSVGVTEAKKAIGWKLGTGQTKLLDSVLYEARIADKLSDTAEDTKLFELYADSPFSYDDAESLAALWGVSVSDAKLQIGWKIRAGDSALIRARLGEIARGAVPARTAEDADEKALDHYIRSDFSYADSSALSAFWSISLHDAKLRIGWKLAAGQDKLLQNMLYEARIYERKLGEDLLYDDSKLFDLYADSAFSYNDAEALAAVWDVSVSDAKLQIGWKISAGDSGLIHKLLAD